MNSALLGLTAAIAWGIHDFIGRFTSRVTGVLVTTFGLVLSGLVVLSVYIFGFGLALPQGRYELGLSGLAGAGYALACLCLFSGYRIGSMSVVSPIAGSYPALAVVFGFLTGSRPSVAAWLAIAAVIAGTVLVSMAGKAHEETGHVSKGKLPMVIGFAIATALFFAVSLIAGQIATPLAGEVQTTWLARVFALAAVIPMFAITALRGPAPLKWWPALIVMGLLDTVAMMSVFAAGAVAFPEMAIVLGGAFGAVVTVLAWWFLKEPVSLRQWLGVALVCTGAGVLSAGY